MGRTVFGIEICANHESDDDLIKLLFKNVKFYKAGEEIKLLCKFELDFKEYDEIHYIQYDDYLIDGKKPETIVVEDEDQYYDIMNEHRITFGPIKLVMSICNKVLGYVTKDDPHNISTDDMVALLSLRNKLFNQGRIKGNFFFGGDCCS